jgi:plastocyanin
MRFPIRLAIAFSLLVPAAASAKDVYLSIAGSVGNFRTDARIFNPSSTKDITINAYFLPVNGASNAAATPMSITVPKRKMLVYDDVVTSLFQATGLGSIRLSSADEFVATSRIYAQTASGTLGQFVQGLDTSAAKNKGVVIQLKSNATFRTNIGFVNPNNAPATITLRLYDRNNAQVGQTALPSGPVAPFGVVGPTNVLSDFNTSADLTDAWVSFDSDQPVFAYGSVVDNGTTDPTYIPFAPDSDNTTSSATPAETYTITASRYVFAVSPVFNVTQGDLVLLRLTATDTTHGFILIGPDGQTLIGPMDLQQGQTIEKTFSAAKEGTYSYSCTHHTCGVGHATMTGSFSIGPPTKDPGGPGY